MENNNNDKSEIKPKNTKKYIITWVILTLVFIVLSIKIYKIISKTSDTFVKSNFEISNELEFLGY